mmetsp:Transcript_29160/g.33357  ORF Transcript_29160/g.33357 Transcript_29160/m.33357 type:complete len:821 (-) Transcript_29160:2783-5245(-)
MDKIISKDTVHEDRSKMIPVERAAFDVKYYLFNKNFGNDQSEKLNEFNDYKNKSSTKEFQYKLLREIITIFHFFDDLRQHYLMSNMIEFFYRNVFSKFDLQDNEVFSKEDTEKMNQILLDEFIHLIPDSEAFHNHMSYELPNIDKMYERNELMEYAKSLNKEDLDKAEMHDEFVTLLIDTFNEHSRDSFLRQLVMLLICRYNSERAEFIRNLDRVILFFNSNDFNFYRWTQEQMDKFVHLTEKSNIWLLKTRNVLKGYEDDLYEFGILEDMQKVKAILNSLKRAMVYRCCIFETDDGVLDIEIQKGERKINVFAQDLYRNLKVYDYLLNFLFQNKELLLLVRRIKLEELSPQQSELVKPIRRIFYKIFRVLEVMTIENPRTQDLMWKYKEEFTLKELGDIEQEGELEFVLSIIDDSSESVKNNQNMWTLSKTRQFVNGLNKRIGGKENFVILLEIYNKLIKFESISFLKHSLAKLILTSAEDFYTYTKTTRKEFEKSLNIQEIIYSIIYDQKMLFMRDFLKTYFPLNGMFDMIEKSIANLEVLESKDNEYDSQDYDEFRDYQYMDLIDIYEQLYFSTENSNTEREDIFNSFSECIAPKYIEMMNNFNMEADFEDSSSFRKSELKFLMIYMQNFCSSLKKYTEALNEEKFDFSINQSEIGRRSNREGHDRIMKIEKLRKCVNTIDKIYSEILERLDRSNNDVIDEIIQEIHDCNQLNMSLRHSTRKEIKVGLARMSSKIGLADHMKDMTNTRTPQSLHFSKVWETFVFMLINERRSRELIDEEQRDLVKLMFNTLTNPDSNKYVIASFRTFISTSIDYVYL